jgi:hypothetical protein
MAWPSLVHDGSVDPHTDADRLPGPRAAAGHPEAAVLAAAERRASALAAGDRATLLALLHPRFSWTTHTGVSLDRGAYARRNTDGPTRWVRQQLIDPRVVVVGTTGVLCCTVVDEVQGADGPETLRMPMTQVWCEDAPGDWVLLSGHAGPRLPTDT